MANDTGGASKREELIQQAGARALANDKNSGCSQSVLLALQDVLKIGGLESFKSATVLSGGLRQGGTCGAVLGALMGLGLVFGREKMEDKDKYSKAMEISRDITDRFKEELQKQFGFDEALESVLCPDIQEKILGRSFDMWEESQDFLEAGGHSDTGCPKVCTVAAQVAAEKILNILQGEKQPST